MVKERRKKIYSSLLVSVFVISIFSHVFLFGPMVMVSRADPGDVSDSYYNATTLNVTVLQLEPRINWYDLQNATGASFLNAQLDVNQNYYFRVNISSDQGWADIEYIWIRAWADLGTDPGSFNGSLGGNINLNLTYDNSTETASAFMAWPNNNSEATFIGWSEVNVTGSDPGGSPGYTNTYNITFIWRPSYQFRYTPDPTDPAPGFNDTWSWNFNITVLDDDGYYSYNNPIVGETINEFGIYSYTEIVSAGWPVIVGNPGDTPAYNNSYIAIETRSNGNYSFSVNVTNLTHKLNPTYFIQNTSILTAGGELSPLTLFPGNAPQYYYGGVATFTAALNNSSSLSTNDVEWAVNIPSGQFPGDYNASIYYHLRTQT